MQLGNGRWESTQFNSRLQPTQIALGTTQNGTDQLRLNYDYGTTANNGNVQSQTITTPTVGANPGFTAIQAYTYDSLNRLKSATETIGGSQSWKQTFLYDRYGNKNFDTANTTTLGSCPQVQCNPTVSATNNRFTSGQGYAYDLSGNVITDAEGRTFTFDAENKQTLVKDINNATIGQYYYDGDGKRVKKSATTENIVFVYDAMGRSVEEYSGSTLQTAYVYAGSRLLTTENQTGTSYLTSDNLGTPRINTDSAGTVTVRHDYMPFGEEIFAVGGRISGLGYNSDTVRKKFTGYERDEESDLDYAQARYFKATHGRFTSPDPYLPSALLELPQSWNRYSYVLNKPFTYVDPDGEDWVKTDDKDNPYEWVDKCAKGQKDCYHVVAAEVGNNLRVYGSKDEKDITNYEANKYGMVDMREVAKHHDAEFVVKSGAGEPYLNTRTGSGLFNVSYQYRQLFPNDEKLMMTAGSLASGGSLPIHESHKRGNNVDIRYMGEDGRTIQSPRAVELADVERTKKLQELFREQNSGLDNVITGNPLRFGWPDIQSQSLKNIHKNHMHFQRNYPRTVSKRPGRQKN